MVIYPVFQNEVFPGTGSGVEKRFRGRGSWLCG